MNAGTSVDPDRSERSRDGPLLLVVTTASLLAALALFRRGFGELWYDSFHYFTLSRIVSTEGFWNLHSRVRTYGYPLFVALCTGFRDPGPAATRALVFAAQLVVYLGVSFHAARVAGRVFRSRRIFLGTYLLTALNPIALARTTEVLSDLVSAALILLAVLRSVETDGSPKRRAFGAFLWAGLSVAVRPANLSVVPALVLIWILRKRLCRERPARTLATGAAALALALLPQLQGNVRAYDAWTPLLPDHLYGDQARWGMSMLKYGTLVIPGVRPELVYENPFYAGGAASPTAFLRAQPLRYAATLVLHGFALVDQDFPFSFITNPRPRSRWPISLWNYGFLFLAGCGLASGLARWRAQSTEARLYLAAAATTGLAYLAVYLPVAVESRFSLPLYLIASPAAASSLVGLWGRPLRTLVPVAAAAAAFIAACFWLSLWLTAQAPVLVELARR